MSAFWSGRHAGQSVCCLCSSQFQPSAGIDTYQDLKSEVERRVSEINGIYGSPLLSPINYLYQTVTQEELCALYRVADVCFVSPVRDDWNLVAKEYVVCREDGGGALVISELRAQLASWARRCASSLGHRVHGGPVGTRA